MYLNLFAQQPGVATVGASPSDGLRNHHADVIRPRAMAHAACGRAKMGCGANKRTENREQREEGVFVLCSWYLLIALLL